MKERKPYTRIGAWPVIFFVTFCILGTIVGIAINKHYYAIERGEMNSPNSSQEDQDASP
ncbi:MAG: hypothetical protein QOF03_57 [Alphaproteobacteria bacterium]|nr:hypothetical protein [Alphaproteobacteria bacterium]